MVAEMRPPLPLAAWEKTEEFATMDAFRFRMLHRKLYTHRQRLDNAKGTHDNHKIESEVDALRQREENMRVSRLKHQAEASLELKRENTRLVERLCSVMRESVVRQKQIAAPRPPGGAPPSQGTLNTAFRRKVARQIDKENYKMLDRLLQAGPQVATRNQLESRYQVHKDNVTRASRVKRKGITDINKLPPPPRVKTKEQHVPIWRRTRMLPPLGMKSADTNFASFDPARSDPDGTDGNDLQPATASCTEGATAGASAVAADAITSTAPTHSADATAAPAQAPGPDMTGEVDAEPYDEYDFEQSDADSLDRTENPAEATLGASFEQERDEAAEEEDVQAAEDKGAILPSQAEPPEQPSNEGILNAVAEPTLGGAGGSAATLPLSAPKSKSSSDGDLAASAGAAAIGGNDCSPEATLVEEEAAAAIAPQPAPEAQAEDSAAEGLTLPPEAEVSKSEAPNVNTPTRTEQEQVLEMALAQAPAEEAPQPLPEALEAPAAAAIGSQPQSEAAVALGKDQPPTEPQESRPRSTATATSETSTARERRLDGQAEAEARLAAEWMFASLTGDRSETTNDIQDTGAAWPLDQLLVGKASSGGSVPSGPAESQNKEVVPATAAQAPPAPVVHHASHSSLGASAVDAPAPPLPGGQGARSSSGDAPPVPHASAELQAAAEQEPDLERSVVAAEDEFVKDEEAPQMPVEAEAEAEAAAEAEAEVEAEYDEEEFSPVASDAGGSPGHRLSSDGEKAEEDYAEDFADEYDAEEGFYSDEDAKAGEKDAGDKDEDSFKDDFEEDDDFDSESEESVGEGAVKEAPAPAAAALLPKEASQDSYQQEWEDQSGSGNFTQEEAVDDYNFEEGSEDESV